MIDHAPVLAEVLISTDEPPVARADEEARGAHEEFVELAAALERIEDAGESTAQGGPLEQRLEELADGGGGFIDR